VTPLVKGAFVLLGIYIVGILVAYTHFILKFW